MDKKNIKSIIGWIIYVLIIGVLIFGIPRGLSYALDTPYPMAAITSGSMWPDLEKGDLVLIHGVKDRSEIKIGDIVIYQNAKGFTIHRVVKIKNDTVITKGDANNVEDIPITYDEIIGKAVLWGDKPLKVPILGNINIYLNKDKL